MKIKFGYLISMTNADIEAGELTVKSDGRIGFIGHRAPDDFKGETLDLSDCLVMPGFVNSHCHLTLSALAGKIDPTDSFVDWVLSLLELDSGLSDGERLGKCQIGVDEMLQSGVTAFADYLGRPDLLPQYVNFPMRQIVFLEAIGFRSDLAENIGKRIESVLRTGSPAPGRISLGVAPHSVYSVSPTLFRHLRKLAYDYDIPISSHVSELVEEKEFLKSGCGELRRLLDSRNAFDFSWNPPKKSSLKYLADLKTLDSMIAIHLNHIDGEENLLNHCRMSAVFCPRSTRWFSRQKYMNLSLLINKGISVGLGTDSLASNENLNFLDELRTAESMATDLNRNELLFIATRGGARALDLGTGLAAPGHPADLIAFRVPVPPTCWSDVPFDPDRRAVDFLMVGGKIIINR